ncbi:MAG: response regulator transcription factor [Clostridia bacterium]|nr:response regulator transcription factor [Clostridia bacterium]
MKTVLIAEDEQSIREFTVINLKRAGFDVIEAEDGAQALEKYKDNKDKIDVVVLDVMMPKLDGTEVCKEIRQIDSHVGIIMLTAKTGEEDRVLGLRVGADDYVSKPFSIAEFLARVDAVYRRSSVDNKRENLIIESGDFTLDLGSRLFLKKGNIIELTQVEFKIMQFLLENMGRAISRKELHVKVWGNSHSSEEKIVDVNIRRLRMKVEDNPSQPEHLVTVWGIGYRWI